MTRGNSLCKLKCKISTLYPESTAEETKNDIIK